MPGAAGGTFSRHFSCRPRQRRGYGFLLSGRTNGWIALNHWIRQGTQQTVPPYSKGSRYSTKSTESQKHASMNFLAVKSPHGELMALHFTDTELFDSPVLLEIAPEKLWHRVRGKCGITKPEFMSYYAGKATAFAIGVAESWLLESMVELSALRTEEILPPQVYRYLTACETTMLHGS